MIVITTATIIVIAIIAVAITISSIDSILELRHSLAYRPSLRSRLARGL